MKKFLITLLCMLIVSCTKQDQKVTDEIQIANRSCYSVSDPSKNPDLQIITNAEEVRPLLPDGQTDSLSFFFTKYSVRTNPIRLTQNYVSPPFYTTRYGWDSGVVVNRVQLQCLVENIAPFGCANDWVFDASQGYLVGTNVYFDGLFEFSTYEKGNGNNWKFLYTDFKKEFYPYQIPAAGYKDSTFCYYDRAIPAQTGDFYYNYFRFPNHDGIYKVIIRFNPQVKGCRAIKETNYENNEKTVTLQILNGTVTIIR